MAIFKLPKLQARSPIVDKEDRPTNYFLRFLNVDYSGAIETAVNAQANQIALNEQILATQQQQLMLINEALELAGIAIGLSGGNSGSTTTELDLIFPTWVLGPVVNLTGVVAGNLTIPGSGLISKSATRSAFGDFNGELRLVEIVGGVDTIIGGPWAFVASRSDPDPAGTVYISNPGEVSSFTSARSTTGAVSYRIDARMLTSDLNNIDVKLYARRTT